MTTFIALVLLLFAMAILFTLYPFLFRGRQSGEAAIDQRQINIDIAREQLASLEQGLRAGEISREEHEALKYELETALIDDISDADGSTGKTADPVVPGRGLLVVVALFIPLSATLLYLQLGSPGLLDKPAVQPAVAQHAAANGGKKPSVDELIAALEARLEQTPEDQAGWMLLARSYMALRRFDEAYRVYTRLLALQGENANILVSMADALSMANGGVVQGEPEKLLQRALTLEPNNVVGLWLLGIAERDRGNQERALQYWQKLYPLLTAADERQRLAELIRSVGGTVEAGRVDAVRNAVPVTVTLAPGLEEKIRPDDLVFLYAKALQGPPMPLAAVRLRVSDLPVTVKLDDSKAMMPSMKMSNFPQVKIGVRISRSGQPVKQKGDWTSQEVVVDLNAVQPLELRIDTLVE